MEKSPFSLRLISLRKANGMTQEELAKKLELNRSTYTCYETGTSMPSIATLIAMADLFHVSVDHLLGRTDRMQTTDAEDSVSLLEEMQVIEQYRRLKPECRKLVMMIMREF